MKSKIIIILICILFTMKTVNAATLPELNITTKELPEERRDFYLNQYQIKNKIGGRPHELGFYNYDVNELGEIALASGYEEKKIIHIYSNESRYLGGFEFGYKGPIYIKWIGSDYMYIYLDGSNIRITMDLNADIIDAVSYENSYENSIYLKTNVYEAEKNQNGVQYVATKNLGPLNLIQPCFSKLICFDENGQEKTIYDVTVWQFLRTIPFVIVLIFIFPIGGYIVLKIIKQTKFVNKK